MGTGWFCIDRIYEALRFDSGWRTIWVVSTRKDVVSYIFLYTFWTYREEKHFKISSHAPVSIGGARIHIFLIISYCYLIVCAKFSNQTVYIKNLLSTKMIRAAYVWTVTVHMNEKWKFSLKKCAYFLQCYVAIGVALDRMRLACNHYSSFTGSALFRVYSLLYPWSPASKGIWTFLPWNFGPTKSHAIKFYSPCWCLNEIIYAWICVKIASSLAYELWDILSLHQHTPFTKSFRCVLAHHVSFRHRLWITSETWNRCISHFTTSWMDQSTLTLIRSAVYQLPKWERPPMIEFFNLQIFLLVKMLFFLVSQVEVFHVGPIALGSFLWPHQSYSTWRLILDETDL